ncbi:MAG: hypothetical protein AAF986_06055 [Pseudomonadota bacterium]
MFKRLPGLFLHCCFFEAELTDLRFIRSDHFRLVGGEQTLHGGINLTINAADL